MSEPKAGDVGASPREHAEVPPTTAAEPRNDGMEELEDVPDPDEDDLDDLDDMLDDFSTVKVDEKPKEVPTGPGRPDVGAPPLAAAAAAAPKPSTADAPGEEALSDEEFAKQLQAGMADLLGELESSPEMHAQFENIFKELGAAASAGATPGAPVPGPSSTSTAKSVPEAGPSTEASFQDTIRKTMERMQTSGDEATAAAAAEGGDDFLAELLKQMQAGGLDGEGGEEDFSKMLLGMMEQLTNKDILYEPMKELNEKFPDWMQKNKDKTPKEDLKRYEEQQALVKEIVIKFEERTYSDTNTADREYIVDRMQKMQAAGAPPSDLVGEMPSAQEALNMPDESCNPQ